MALDSKIIPPEQSQREDNQFKVPDTDIVIDGNSQCMGNTFQDLLFSFALEIGEKTLQMSTDAYYRGLYGFLLADRKARNNSKPIKREEFFLVDNHVRYLNDILIKNKYGVICEWKSIASNPEIIVNLLERHKRPVGMGTQTTGPGGHWFIAIGHDAHNIKAHDYFGTFPYRTEHQKKAVKVSYSKTFLAQKGLRRYAVITGTPNKSKKEKDTD